MKPVLTLLLAFLLIDGSQAQIKESWTAPTNSAQWLRTTSAGALVAGTATGLQGIDPRTGEISWTVAELASTTEDGYTELQGTPFITMVPSGRSEELFVIEPFSGQVVFSSKASGINNIASKYVLPENNALVVVGQKNDKTATMACVDMGTGKVRWTKDDSFSRLTACNSAGPDAILLSTLFFAYKLDALTGNEIWKKSPDPSFEKMAGLTSMLDKGGANLAGMADIQGVFITTEHAEGLCFMGMQTKQQKESTDSQGKTTTSISYKTFVNAFNIADGSYAWAQPLTMAQQLGTVIPLEQGLLVGAADRNSAELLDYGTGEGIWGKKGSGVNLKGTLNGAVPLEGGRTLLTSGGKDGSVMLFGREGTELWKKAVKLSGLIQRVTLLRNDILVATDEEVDVIDLATGLSKLEKPLKGGANLIAMNEGVTYIFNTKDDLLYSMPAEGGTVKAVSSTPLVLDGKEEPTQLEYSENGLVLTSDQNIALIGTDGTVKYQKHFPAGKESGLTRALKYASAVRAAYYTAVFGYTSAAFGAVAQQIDVHDTNSAIAQEVSGGLSDVFGDAANEGFGATKRFLQEANARLKASATTNEVHFMMTDAGKREYQLVAINKADGTVIGTIPLGRDKTPVYEVDVFTNTVYLVDNGNVKAFMM